MQLHVKILGWLFIANALFMLLPALLVFGIFTGLGIAIPDFPLLGVSIGGMIATVLAVMALPSLITGVGLLLRQGWARILGIIMGILSLWNVPVGTALGVYALWVLFQERTREVLR